MLKVSRPTLDPAIADDLVARQRAVDDGTATLDPWKDFKKDEAAREKAGTPSVLGALAGRLHGKCVYCETKDAPELDHHWPKAPHAHNRRLGTPSKMFVWENLVLSCHRCNSWECKGSHMDWCADGRTKLLNPFMEADDPLCHFTIETNEGGAVGGVGWLELRSDLTGAALERADYTRKRLKLNLRRELLSGRAATLRRFLDLVADWRRLGADHVVRPGRTVRKIFLQLLDPSEPHLGPIRQVLRGNLALRDDLLAAMPELRAPLDAWDLPPFDCSKIA